MINMFYRVIVLVLVYIIMVGLGLVRAANPEPVWSTYLGGNGVDRCLSAATDGQGNVFVGGETASTNLAAQNGVFKAYNGGDLDGFVAKFNSVGQLLWLTYLGGSSTDSVYDMAVDGAGNILVTGYTGSANFPVLKAADATYHENHDAFVAKFDTNGVLLWSTFLGGTNTDEAYAIAVDGAGNAYVTGRTGSANFTTKNAAQPTHGGGFDAFVSKFTSAGALAWSTFLGGNDKDPVNYPEAGLGIVVYKDVGVWVTGQTSAANFPVTAGEAQTLGGVQDAFLTGYTPDGGVKWSRLYGGSGQDYANGLAVDSAGNFYLTGLTLSADLPGPVGFAHSAIGARDAFLAKIDQNASVQWKTWLGGFGDDEGFSVAVDQDGLVNVCGVTASGNFPVSLGGALGQEDAFVMQVDTNGRLVHSAYWGGSSNDQGLALAIDPLGRVILAGTTATAANFPLLNAAQSVFGGVQDGFVAALLWRNATRHGWELYQ